MAKIVPMDVSSMTDELSSGSYSRTYLPRVEMRRYVDDFPRYPGHLTAPVWSLILKMVCRRTRQLLALA
jgi:hypothetical protein